MRQTLAGTNIAAGNFPRRTERASRTNAIVRTVALRSAALGGTGTITKSLTKHAARGATAKLGGMSITDQVAGRSERRRLSPPFSGLS